MGAKRRKIVSILICKECQTEFVVPQYLDDKALFCSQACLGHYKIKQTRELHKKQREAARIKGEETLKSMRLESDSLLKKILECLGTEKHKDLAQKINSLHKKELKLRTKLGYPYIIYDPCPKIANNHQSIVPLCENCDAVNCYIKIGMITNHRPEINKPIFPLPEYCLSTHGTGISIMEASDPLPEEAFV